MNYSCPKEHFQAILDEQIDKPFDHRRLQRSLNDFFRTYTDQKINWTITERDSRVMIDFDDKQSEERARAILLRSPLLHSAMSKGREGYQEQLMPERQKEHDRQLARLRGEWIAQDDTRAQQYFEQVAESREKIRQGVI